MNITTPKNIKKAAVIGYPISHSRSPILHRFWLKQYEIAGEYTAIEVPPEGLADFIKTMTKNGFCGVNVTIPHKEAVINLLDEIDDTARKIGAVNTIIADNGKLLGKNTDAYGFAENILPFVRGKKKAVVLGAGGAARAVVYALHDIGFSEIVVTNRTLGRALELKDMNIPITVVGWAKRTEALDNANLLVNTTSLGMAGKPTLEIDLSLLPKTALVTDIVYSPLMTNLLARAQARGNATVDGLGMLLHQAVPAFAAWFGVKPVVSDELRSAVLIP